MAKKLETMGAHFLGIKDMAGLCKPYAAYELVKALREEIGIPIHFHTHDTSGVNAASVLKAADAGVDVADGAIAAMSGGTSQPNLNSIVEALRHSPRDTGLDIEALNECSDYWEVVRTYYDAFDSGPTRGLGAALSARNSRRPIYEFARTSHGSGTWPPLARGGDDVRGSESAFWRHRESDAVEQSGRRHDAVSDVSRNAAARHSEARRASRSCAAEFGG